MRRLAFIGALFVMICPALAAPAADFVGHWAGSGDIIVNWCDQPTLDFDLVIAKDGTVTGRIGDAELLDGKLSRRSWVMRMLGNGTYWIKGELGGDLVAAEGIRREKILLFPEFVVGAIEGSLNTSGSKFGGKEKMYMTVTDIVLNRVAADTEH